MRRQTLTLSALLALSPLTPAAAQPGAGEAPAEPGAEALDRARTLFITGSQAYRDDKYLVAIEAFQAAFELAPRASIVFALAQANRLQYFVDGKGERLEQAVELYRGYLERDDVDPASAELAVRHLASLTPQLQRLTRKKDSSIGRIIVSSNVDSARVRLGDQEPVEVPAAFEVKPGPIQVIVEAPGYATQTREIVALGGTGIPVDVQLVPLPGSLKLVTEDGAQVLIDGRAMGSAPVGPLDLAPGEHRVVVLASGRAPSVNTVTIAPTTETVLDVPLDETGQRVAAWGMFGVAGALAATAGIMAVLAVQEQQKAEDLHALWRADGLDPEQVTNYREHLAKRDDWALRTVAVGVGAGVAGALGAALWLLDDPKAPNQPILTPTIAPDGSSAGVVGHFRF